MKVLKKASMDRKTKRLLSHEVINMEKFHHPHIIKIFEVKQLLFNMCSLTQGKDEVYIKSI